MFIKPLTYLLTYSLTVLMYLLVQVKSWLNDVMNEASNDAASSSPRDHAVTSPSDGVVQSQPSTSDIFSNGPGGLHDLDECIKEDSKLSDSEYRSVLPRDAMQDRAACAVMRCPSVCPSVCHVRVFCRNE